MRVACPRSRWRASCRCVRRRSSAQTVLTLADVLARAREQAPQIVSARLALEEARGRLAGASLRLQSNPEVDVSVGNRQGSDARSTDLQFGAAQMFEPPGRRAARIAGATAQLDQGAGSRRRHDAGRAARRGVVVLSGACTRRSASGSSTASEELAGAILQAADRRYRAGDLAVLDVNLARCVAGARARRPRSRRGRARRRAGSAAGAARLDGRVRGAGQPGAGEPPDAAALAQSAEQRPELRALEAAIREADADSSLAGRFARPDYGVGLRYQREGGDHIVLGGLTLTLPLFSKGQELRAVGIGPRAPGCEPSSTPRERASASSCRPRWRPTNAGSRPRACSRPRRCRGSTRTTR